MNDRKQTDLRREFWSLPDEALVDRDTAGAVLYLGRVSMEAYAVRGDGPAYRRLGRRALYLKRDLLQWAEKTGRKVTSTAESA